MMGKLQPTGIGSTSINGWGGLDTGNPYVHTTTNGITITSWPFPEFDFSNNIMINKKFKSKLGILNKKMKFRILCKEYCDGHKEYIPQFRKWYQVQWVNLLASGTKQFSTTEDDAHKVLAQATKELVKHNEVIGEYDVEAYKKVSN